MAAFERGDFDRAIVDFGHVIGIAPNSVMAYNMRGNAYQLKNDYNRAIADYDQAIRLQPNVASIYYNRGQTHYVNKNHDKAIADFETVLRIDPNHHKARGLLQMVKMISGLRNLRLPP
jgi:tetratricopeptide (TPR) repeat protein